MIYAVMWGYVSGWLVAAMVLAAIVKGLNDPSRPQPHPFRVAVAAGAVWPLVILGATQMAVVALVVDTTRCRTRRARAAGRAIRRVAGTAKVARRRSAVGPDAVRPRRGLL